MDEIEFHQFWRPSRVPAAVESSAYYTLGNQLHVNCRSVEKGLVTRPPGLRGTVNCRSVEKCVLRTEVFYHYFSMQPRNMQCTQFFNGPAIDCSPS